MTADRARIIWDTTVYLSGLLLLGLKEMGGGWETRELVMLAIRWRGDTDTPPPPPPTPPPPPPSSWGHSDVSIFQGKSCKIIVVLKTSAPRSDAPIDAEYTMGWRVIPRVTLASQWVSLSQSVSQSENEATGGFQRCYASKKQSTYIDSSSWDILMTLSTLDYLMTSSTRFLMASSIEDILMTSWKWGYLMTSSSPYLVELILVLVEVRLNLE